MDRVEYLRRGLSRDSSYGIEIGPFFNPIAPKADGWKTTIVDFTGTHELQHTANTHSSPVIRRMATNIEPVDVIWRDVRLDEACRRLRPDGYDFLIASHVIEHLPDPIAFLQQVSALARPGFVLSLAVPDLRFCFDFFKPITSTSDWLRAHGQRRKIHSAETLFQAKACNTLLDGVGCWLPSAKGTVTLADSLDDAHRRYKNYLDAEQRGTQQYVDMHAWAFTPSSFELIILELNHLGYTDFLINTLDAGDGSEFLTQLTRRHHKLDACDFEDRRLALHMAVRNEMAASIRFLPQPYLSAGSRAATPAMETWQCDESALDAGFYRAYYADLSDLSSTELESHFQLHGKEEGRYPSMRAFLRSLEATHGALPPDFDAHDYLAANPDLIPSVLQPWQSAQHYLSFGRKEGRPYKRAQPGFAVPRDFDPIFYRSYYPDLQRCSLAELEAHYVSHGRTQGRYRNERALIEWLESEHGALPADFDGREYLAANMDLLTHLRATWEPAQHYLLYGRKEGRRYNRNQTWPNLDEDFDYLFYRSFYPDAVELSRQQAIDHYMTHGKPAGRFRNEAAFLGSLQAEHGELPEQFDRTEYLAANPDLSHLSQPWEPAFHYLRYGRAEGRALTRRDERTLVYEEDTVHRATLSVYDMPEVVVDHTRQPSINVLVPAFDFGSMSAGFFGVFQVALFIKRCGFHVRLVMYDTFDFDLADAKKKLANYPGMESTFDECEVVYIGDRKKPLRISPHDNCVATVWYSAYLARKIMQARSGGSFLYLVQDYESVFHPAGTLSTLADATYAFDCCAFFSTEALQDFFIQTKRGNFWRDASRYVYFNNASSGLLPPKKKFLSQRSEKRRRLAFYSRPRVDRNMFELGVLTLCAAVKAGVFPKDEWELVGIGLGKAIIRLGEDREVEQMTRLTLAEYREVISTFDVGFCLMASSHPSLLPFDLSGSGAVVVTNSHGVKDQAYFDTVTRGVIVAPPDIPALVAALERAVRESEDLETRYANARAMTFPQTWNETFHARHETFIRRVFTDTLSRTSHRGEYQLTL